jgi:hypothetical protein
MAHNTSVSSLLVSIPEVRGERGKRKTLAIETPPTKMKYLFTILVTSEYIL